MSVSEKLLQFFGIFFGSKIRLFAQGQREIFKRLSGCLQKGKPVIWFHVSSLGEYEQALPVMEKIKETYPDYQMVLSFFSPSGYEIKKDKTPTDCVTYLPLDTRKNARQFLDLLQPEAVFFVKYDFWPNYLTEIKKRRIPAFLISGLFHAGHSFFKPYNAWLKKSLGAFQHFFVQDDESKKVLNQQGFTSVTLTGDTRFDRVYQIAQASDELPLIKKFKQDLPLLVIGSSWQSDEKLLIPYINHAKIPFKTIIAPHDIAPKHIRQITDRLKRPYILYSQIDTQTDMSDYDVLIIDNIGLLNKIYRYADIVYIGNGFGKSIHNIQEPAVYGVPIITGPHIEKFKEAVDLQKSGGLSLIHNAQELESILNRLLTQSKLRKQKASITRDYALQNVGATQKIMKHLKTFL